MSIYFVLENNVVQQHYAHNIENNEENNEENEVPHNVEEGGSKFYKFCFNNI